LPTPFSLRVFKVELNKMKRYLQPLRLDATQGASEERSEMYLTYIERVPQLATPRCAISACGVCGLAEKQASAAHRL
jgi:hypothetical protein